MSYFFNIADSIIKSIIIITAPIPTVYGIGFNITLSFVNIKYIVAVKVTVVINWISPIIK